MSNVTFEKLYEGKAKVIYRDPATGELVQRFKDAATAFNGVKFAEIEGKGELNNRISSTLFRHLQAEGVPSHYLGTVNTRDMRIKAVEIIPLEVVWRRIVAGSLAKRTGLDEGTVLSRPIVEFYYKDDALGDPMLADEHVDVLGIATEPERSELRRQALKVGEVTSAFWAECGLRLVDFKLEFGRDENGTILLADEISPDTSRLWDEASEARMDKDVFRRDLADLRNTYAEVHRRLRERFPELEPGELPPAPAAR